MPPKGAHLARWADTRDISSMAASRRLLYRAVPTNAQLRVGQRTEDAPTLPSRLQASSRRQGVPGFDYMAAPGQLRRRRHFLSQAFSRQLPPTSAMTYTSTW